MKIKKVLITLVASVGLITTATTVNKNEEQTVKADGQYQDPPKALRGKWYDLNKHDSNYFYILGTKKSIHAGNAYSDTLFENSREDSKNECIKTEYKKLGKNNYDLIQTIQNKKSKKIVKDVNNEKVKNISYKGKKYRVLLIGYRHPGRTVKRYWGLFSKNTSKKIGKALLKKCHLSKKVLKKTIKESIQ